MEVFQDENKENEFDGYSVPQSRGGSKKDSNRLPLRDISNNQRTSTNEVRTLQINDCTV